MPRILLVDDDPDIVETLRYVLEHEGLEVEVDATAGTIRMLEPAVA